MDIQCTLVQDEAQERDRKNSEVKVKATEYSIHTIYLNSFFPKMFVYNARNCFPSLFRGNRNVYLTTRVKL
jgi:hypothetical protein